MSVLVTVVSPGGADDLELDDTLAVGELCTELARVLGEEAPATLRTAAGVELPAATTLAAAGVLDGSTLTLVPAPAGIAGITGTAGTARTVAPVLACYLVIDTSDSMTGPVLDAVNAELSRLWAAARADPRLADPCHLAVVAFDAQARLVAPLTAAGRLGRAPHLTATRPATNYEAAFRLLRVQVDDDLAALRGAGRRPLRPLAVLLTDGRPTRGYWPAAHARLVDPAVPDPVDLVVFGLGDAAEATVRRVGVAGAFVPARGGDAPALVPAGMLAAVMGFVLGALAGSLPRQSVDEAPPAGWRPLQGTGR